MNQTTRKLVFSALFLALAFVLPFLTGQIPQIGSALLPMHLPVLLCGFVCGAPWGLVVGFAAPLLRSLCFGMPPFFPTAVCMAFELAAYGFLAGLFYRLFPRKKGFVYPSLFLAMLGGRLIWGLARLCCAGLDVSRFGIEAFWVGAFAAALPGILVQILLIPPLVLLFEKFRWIER